jgi:hypothetical protein
MKTLAAVGGAAILAMAVVAPAAGQDTSNRGASYGAGNPETTPTLDKGGALSAAMVGPIGGDPNGFLAHYVYTVRSGKNSYDVWMSVAVVRFEGREGLRLRLGPSQPLWGDTYAVFDDWHGFDTGSAEVDAAYIVETRDETDEVQLDAAPQAVPEISAKGLAPSRPQHLPFACPPTSSATHISEKLLRTSNSLEVESSSREQVLGNYPATRGDPKYLRQMSGLL